MSEDNTSYESVSHPNDKEQETDQTNYTTVLTEVSFMGQQHGISNTINDALGHPVDYKETMEQEPNDIIIPGNRIDNIDTNQLETEVNNEDNNLNQGQYTMFSRYFYRCTYYYKFSCYQCVYYRNSR